MLLDAYGVQRMIIGLADDAETMITHTPHSTLVTVMRIEPMFKKDVVLTKRMGIKLRRWKTFVDRIDTYLDKVDAINEGDEVEIQDHIGGGLHVTMSNDFPFLQFREFYLDDAGHLLPGRRGIRLSFDEVAEMKSHVAEFNRMIPELGDIVLCEKDHDDMKCKECKVRK